MKYKIGIFGSAVIENDSILSKAHILGQELGKYNLILITGGGKGLPYLVVSKAKEINKNIEIWAFPPVLNIKELHAYTADYISIYNKIVYVPKEFPFTTKVESKRQYRNVISTTNCDAGIVISGRWGSLNEFTNLHEGGKVIGVLTGTSGIADILPTFYGKIHKKEATAKVFFNSDPYQLVNSILTEINKRK